MDTSNNSRILNIIKGWDQSKVVELLNKNDLQDYIKFTENKNLDGSSFLTLSEGIIAMWKPRVDTKKLISIIEDLHINPQKYYNITTNEIIKNVKLNENAKETSTTTNSEEQIVIKRTKPKVPKRVDSLKNEIDISKIKNRFSMKDIPLKINDETIVEPNNDKSNKNCVISDRNVINLENIVAPKSFLYSQKLVDAVSKLYPYLPMKMARDDVVLRKKTPFNFEDIKTESQIFQDAGYYEMTSRKSLIYGRRHSDSSIIIEANPYEELLFRNKCDDKSTEKKRFALLRKVLRKPTFYWDVFNMKENHRKNVKDAAIDNVNNCSRLQKINEMVVKKFCSKVGSNYKMKDESKSNDVKIDNTVKTVRFKQFTDDEGEDGRHNVVNTIETSTEEIKIAVSGTNAAHYEEPNYFQESNNIISDNSTDLVLNENYYEEAEPLDDSFHEEEITIDVRDIETNNGCRTAIEVEDYLEPIQCFKVQPADTVMNNLADEIIRLFDANMEATDIFKDSQQMFDKDEVYLKETCDNSKLEVQPKPQMLKNDSNMNLRKTPVPLTRSSKPKVPMRSINKTSDTISEQLNKIKESIDVESGSKLEGETTSNERPFDTLHKWNESLRNGAKRKKEAIRRSMIDRPLPVPVENEFYYMEVGRKEAEELLEGHADGTFILRPSSQTSHVYTVTVIYQGRVYNIGCRRRQDGRLALGFSKPGEQSFLTIHQLIQHYYTEKLLLIQDGVKVGSTTLKKLDGS